MNALPAWVEQLKRRTARSTIDCEAKAFYGSEQIARHAGRRTLATYPDRFPARLYVYACVGCRGWHLTSAANARPAVTAHALREGLN